MLPSTLITALSLSLILPSTLAAPSLARQGVTAPRAASPAESYVKVRRRVSSGKQSHGRNRAREHKERACSEPEQESYNPPSTTPAIPTTPFSAMFPVSPRNSWSTADGQSNHKSIDGALKPLAAGRLPELGTAPDNTPALVAAYPAGTVKYSSSTGHGYSFYTAGAHDGVDTTNATDVVFSYSIYFSEGFDFVKGGKLPGLYGGVNADEAKSCSGGRQGERDECFSARLMWRANGAGEIYNYLPTSGWQGNGYCETAPMSKCDPSFGDSIGRGSFYFQPGRWTTVTQRVKLNSPASASNGEQELWVDGHQILHLKDLQLRVRDETKIYGIMAQTFFGGSDQSWASPKDQWAWFKDWSLGVVA